MERMGIKKVGLLLKRRLRWHETVTDDVARCALKVLEIKSIPALRPRLVLHPKVERIKKYRFCVCIITSITVTCLGKCLLENDTTNETRLWCDWRVLAWACFKCWWLVEWGLIKTRTLWCAWLKHFCYSPHPCPPPFSCRDVLWNKLSSRCLRR